MGKADRMAKKRHAETVASFERQQADQRKQIEQSLFSLIADIETLIPKVLNHERSKGRENVEIVYTSRKFPIVGLRSMEKGGYRLYEYSVTHNGSADSGEPFTIHAHLLDNGRLSLDQFDGSTRELRAAISKDLNSRFTSDYSINKWRNTLTNTKAGLEARLKR